MADFHDVFKVRLLEVFERIISFLDENKFEWCVAFGTCLGAIRHKGIIPWDDDIDIFMPRKDYEILKSRQDDLLAQDLQLFSWGDERFPNVFMKIADVNTTVWESESLPVVYGVYIDVFPIDSTNISEKIFSEQYRKFCNYYTKYSMALSNYSFKQFFFDIGHLHLRSLTYGIRNVFFHKFLEIEEYRSKIDQSMRDFQAVDGDNFIVLSGMMPVKYYPKEWFACYEEIPFEYFSVKIMSGWKEYLTKMYGDFMTPPVPFMQRTHHGQYYINLKERLTVDEIEIRKKRGENFVY